MNKSIASQFDDPSLVVSIAACELQKHKSALVKALLSEETTSLRIDSETLSHLLAPII